MIIVRLMGGLGNQMFQYAAARRLAHSNSTHLKIDLSWFNAIEEIETPRHYGLHALAAQEDIATPAEVSRFRNEDQNSFQGMVRKALALFSRDRFIREKHYHFDPSLLTLSGDAYLEGYWQSEKYFKDIAITIRSEFAVRYMPDECNSRMAEYIGGEDSVSLHVRRGDYIASKVTNQFHGVCPLDYYHAAIAEIAGQIVSPHFFIFSDDHDWVKENLWLDFPATFVNHNDALHGYEDLRLMSMCKHHIIANSSFSWWGAWLGSNPHKIVIAPKRWFNDESIETTDLIPETWMRI
jgi:hypothetical protein